MDLTKAVEVRIMKFSPYGSPIHLVFVGFPRAGVSNKGGVGKISSFLALSVNITRAYLALARLSCYLCVGQDTLK